MRWVLVVIIGIVSGVEVSGQEYYASSKPNTRPSILYKSTNLNSSYSKIPLPPGYRMRKVGSTLTIAGAAMFLGGLIVLSDADKTSYYNSSTGQQVFTDPMVGVGSLLIIGGVGMMIPGTIFWVKGAKRYNRYLNDLHGSIKTKGNGLAITLTF